MNSHVKVSIVINNYNYDRFLTQAIDSALEQTYPHTEVIVVDDGSTDQSRDIIASYGSRILPILQTNGKQGKAFNSGFAQATGEIIIFLDSDDWLFPQAVESIVKVWTPKLAKVHYRLQVVDGKGDPMGYSLPQGAGSLSTGEVWQELISKSNYTSTPTSGNALSRAVLEKIFPIPEDYKLTADDYLSMLVPFYGEVAAIEEPMAAYRIHGTNQWAISKVTAARFQRFVRHDLQNYALLTETAAKFGHPIPPDLDHRSIGRIWSRLNSFRLDPTHHPVTGEQIGTLVYRGIRCLWLYSDFSYLKRVLYSLWFLWVGFMPTPLAEPAITWLYTPQQRPKWTGWIVTKLNFFWR